MNKDSQQRNKAKAVREAACKVAAAPAGNMVARIRRDRPRESNGREIEVLTKEPPKRSNQDTTK